MDTSLSKIFEAIVFLFLVFSSMIWGLLLLIYPILFFTENHISSKYQDIISISLVSSVSILLLYAYFGKNSFLVTVKYFTYLTGWTSSLYLLIYGVEAIVGIYVPTMNAMAGLIFLGIGIILIFYFGKKVKKIKGKMDNAT